MTGLSLRQLSGVLSSKGHQTICHGDAEIVGISRDSRRVAPGELFAALPGERRDGAHYAAVAKARGASAILAESRPDTDLPSLVVEDARRAMAHAAHAIYGDPSAALRVIGLTGTNGKTTTSFLIEGVLRAAKRPSALLGTVTQRILDVSEPTLFTTPESDDLVRFIHAAKVAGAAHLVMEVSSHGIALSRVLGVRFDVAAFTNLTQDHLDFHTSMSEYGAVKASLFLDYKPRRSVINIDDEFGRGLAAKLMTQGHKGVLRTSANGNRAAEIYASDVVMSAAGTEARVTTPAGEGELRSPLVGHHNLENLLTTIGVCLASDISLETCMDSLKNGVNTPGRLERVQAPTGDAPSVFVDYAHTPDALRSVLEALRPITSGRLIVVFGCGGDRDRKKRAPMGEAAARGADLCIVTSDNPRTESPMTIINTVVDGVLKGGQRLVSSLGGRSDGAVVQADRKAAIRHAIKVAGPEDTVLIAGKGHEDYQIVGERRLPFDDREQARLALELVVRGEDA